MVDAAGLSDAYLVSKANRVVEAAGFERAAVKVDLAG